MIPKIWYRWLYLAIFVVMLFGVLMVMSPGLVRTVFSALIYSSPSTIEAEFGKEANAYIILLHGVLGAVMFAWGLVMFLVLRGPLFRGEREGWRFLAIPLAAWYIPDTVFSLQTGFWQNALLNSILAFLFAIPLIACFKYFKIKSG